MMDLVQEVRRLCSKPDDLVIVTVPIDVSLKDMAIVARDLRKLLPDGVKGFVLREGYTIETMPLEDARRALEQIVKAKEK